MPYRWKWAKCLGHYSSALSVREALNDEPQLCLNLRSQSRDAKLMQAALPGSTASSRRPTGLETGRKRCLHSRNWKLSISSEAPEVGWEYTCEILLLQQAVSRTHLCQLHPASSCVSSYPWSHAQRDALHWVHCQGSSSLQEASKYVPTAAEAPAMAVCPGWLRLLPS